MSGLVCHTSYLYMMSCELPVSSLMLKTPHNPLTIDAKLA